VLGSSIRTQSCSTMVVLWSLLGERSSMILVFDTSLPTGAGLAICPPWLSRRRYSPTGRDKKRARAMVGDSPSRDSFRPPSQRAVRFRVGLIRRASTYRQPVLGADLTLETCGAPRSSVGGDAAARPSGRSQGRSIPGSILQTASLAFVTQSREVHVSSR